MDYINKTIRIIKLDDPYSSLYEDRVGRVTKSSEEFGRIRLDGTWGSIGIYPDVDEIEVVYKCRWCEEYFTEDELTKEKDLGYLCDSCWAAIDARVDDMEEE